MIPPYKGGACGSGKSAATMEKYLHHVRQFVAAYTGRKIDKALVLEYKARLGESFAPSSANAALAAVNGFSAFGALVTAASSHSKYKKDLLPGGKGAHPRGIRPVGKGGQRKKSSERLALLLESICATGIG